MIIQLRAAIFVYNDVTRDSIAYSLTLRHVTENRYVKYPVHNSWRYNLSFFMFIRFPAILLVKIMDSYLHEFCARGILHSDFQ